MLYPSLKTTRSYDEIKRYRDILYQLVAMRSSLPEDLQIDNEEMLQDMAQQLMTLDWVLQTGTSLDRNIDRYREDTEEWIRDAGYELRHQSEYN